MKTQIKQWGSSMVIVLDPEFLKFYDLNVGDWIDMSDVAKVEPNNTHNDTTNQTKHTTVA